MGEGEVGIHDHTFYKNLFIYYEVSMMISYLVFGGSSGSRERKRSPVIVCSRMGPSKEPLAMRPNSAHIDTHVISVSWPVSTARGMGFSSKNIF